MWEQIKDTLAKDTTYLCTIKMNLLPGSHSFDGECWESLFWIRYSLFEDFKRIGTNITSIKHSSKSCVYHWWVSLGTNYDRILRDLPSGPTVLKQRCSTRRREATDSGRSWMVEIKMSGMPRISLRMQLCSCIGRSPTASISLWSASQNALRLRDDIMTERKSEGCTKGMC